MQRCVRSVGYNVIEQVINSKNESPNGQKSTGPNEVTSTLFVWPDFNYQNSSAFKLVCETNVVTDEPTLVVTLLYDVSRRCDQRPHCINI